MKKEIITASPEETMDLARETGQSAGPGAVFALIGDLGSGKTIFAKGFALAIGIDEDITSPTFTLLEIYEGPLPLYHFDLYRIEDKMELDNLFFEDYWEGGGVSLIEWADRALDRLPDHTIKINFYYIDENRRRIIIEHPGN